MSCNITLRLTLKNARILFHRRMFAALCSLPSASQLAHSICMGNEPNQGQLYINFNLLVHFFVLLLVSVLLMTMNLVITLSK